MTAATASDAPAGIASIRVADELRRAILDGDLAPGSRVRQEALAASTGASRVPVREALRILEAEGLVTLVANTGAWVAELTLEECVELYEVRERIEPLLLRYSAEHLDDAALADLARRADELAHVGADDFLRLDREFHRATYAGARTGFLGDTVERLWNTTQHYRRAFTGLLDERSNRIVHDEHHMLVTALLDGDVEAAEGVLAGHIRRTRLLLARHPEVFTATTTPRA